MTRRDIPRAELRVIGAAGHFLSLDAPDALAATIVDWVAATVRRS